MIDIDLKEIEREVLKSLQTPLTPSWNNPYGNDGNQAFPPRLEISIEISKNISEEAWGLREKVYGYAYSVARIRRLRAILGRNPDELYHNAHLVSVPLIESNYCSDWNFPVYYDLLGCVGKDPPTLGKWFPITNDEQMAIIDIVLGAIIHNWRNPS